MEFLKNTLFIGKELLQLKKVDSTNSYLKELIANNGKQGEGLLILADEQFAGRGQVGNIWQSEPGKNITASILFYPHFLENRQLFYFNKAVTLAVRECIEALINKYGARKNVVYIKWPNDIFIDSKKVAGILIENSFRNSSFEYAIAGIGINVNQEFKHIAALNAVSLKDICGNYLELNKIIELLGGLLEKYYLILKRFDFQKIDSLYQQYLFGLNKNRQFKVNDEIFTGVVKSVNIAGELVLEINTINREFKFKELEWVINNSE